MAKFSLKDSDEYYLALSERPKRFDADSPVTNVFFDDTNGQVFTVRSGGVAGVTVNGMDDSKCTSFLMEDRGPIISIKFSPDHKVLAIQRNTENRGATVEFINFKDLTPTTVEYTHTCKWKNAKILGFVWPKVNEIAYITDHGIELLLVMPEKKQLKSLKSVLFSGAWFTWCPQSNIVLLAGNNGALLQPFALNNSTISKLQKLELEQARPVVERDVLLLRLCAVTWCAVFRHGGAPTEVWLMAIGSSSSNPTHVLKTGLAGRFAVSVVDDLVAVHHQSSQTSLLFDILEPSKAENNSAVHVPVAAGSGIKPASLDDAPCPMYSGHWVVFQPDYVIDVRLGCLWRLRLRPRGLAHRVPKDELPKVVAVLLRRAEGADTVYGVLDQMVSEAGSYLVELSKVFDEINSVYRKWADEEVARNTAGHVPSAGGEARAHRRGALLAQADVCARALQPHLDEKYFVQVLTAYLASLARHSLVVQAGTGALAVRALCGAGAGAGAGAARLRALVRRGALGDSRPLACQLLALGHLQPAAAQLALDMMHRLHAHDEIVEVLLSWERPVAAVGALRAAAAAAPAQAQPRAPPRKLLAAARAHSPSAVAGVAHALMAANERLRGAPDFLKGEHCDIYMEYYKQIMDTA